MLIGLTGQTGAGKSEVCAILLEYGFDIINADSVARDVTRAGSECLGKIVEEFGDKMLRPGGKLDRKALGELVFSDAASLDRLEDIIYPYILREIKKRAGELSPGSKGIFLDAPTLFESGANKFCEKICSVTAPEDLRMERIIARDNLTSEEAANRMNSQQRDEFYASRSHWVINNNGTKGQLRGDVLRMLRAFGLYSHRT